MRELSLLSATAFSLIVLVPLPAHPSGGSSEASKLQPIELAQSSGKKPGQTLQIGTPPPPPGQEGGSLQIGTPPPPPGQQGGSLQIGTPPPAPEGGGGLTIGAPPPSAPAAPTLAPPEEEGPLTFSLPWLRAEGGWHPQSGSRADASGLLSGAVRAEYRPPELERWSLQATLRADSYPQSGRLDDGETELDYGESFVRYEGARTRITAGALKVLWGRVDEIPPTDRLGVQDATRYILDELPDRRRAAPALRIVHSFDALELDAVLMPWFRPAELPDADSLWHPVRQEDGRILGIRAPPLFEAAIRSGTIGEADDFDQFGGWGVRASRRGAGFDAALSVQRVRHSLPYYQLDPAVRAAAVAGAPLPVALASGRGPTLREVHPLTWVVGGDVAFEALGGTVRLEAAWSSDFPVTTFDARLETHDALDWVAGYEFFPGDGNARVTLQVAGHQVHGAPAGILDRARIYSVLGEVEVPFAQDRWRFTTRFSAGLNDRDLYLNPRLSYVGWEPHEIYLGAHLFSGSEKAFNGFHEDNDAVVLGWRARF